MASASGVESILERLSSALATAQVPYMLTGSFASSLHGSPRVTHDIDIVIAPTLGSLNQLLKQFPEEQYYASREAALQAYGSEGMFNVIDLETGWKVDFIIRKQRPFSLEEFERRREAEIEGARIFVASPEDVIVAKLEWAKLGESERQLRDAASIVATRGSELDEAYISRWVERLDLQTQWEKAKSFAP
jgi:hypothetical protein